MPHAEEQRPKDRDVRIKIDLDPEIALRELLKVDPDTPQDAPSKDQGDTGADS